MISQTAGAELGLSRIVRKEVYQMVAFANSKPADAGAKAKHLARECAQQPVKFFEKCKSSC